MPARALAPGRQPAARPLGERALFLGARETGAARRPAAVTQERRRRARTGATNRGSTPAHAPLTLWAWKLLLPTVPGTLWPPAPVGKAYPLRGPGALSFKSGKRSLQLAPRTSKKAATPLGYRSGRLLLSWRKDALCPPLRPAVGTKNRRELSGLHLGRPLPASADPWRPALCQAEAELGHCLSRAGVSAEGVVAKASRKRRTSAQTSARVYAPKTTSLNLQRHSLLSFMSMPRPLRAAR